LFIVGKLRKSWVGDSNRVKLYIIRTGSRLIIDMVISVSLAPAKLIELITSRELGHGQGVVEL
jgi:hypothetical protein